jgi:hypothetical protein
MKIFQAVPSGNQNKWISKNAISIDYSKLPPGTEYDLFKYAFNNLLGDEEYWGVVSWKFNIKTPVDVDIFSEFCKAEFTKGVDCVFINPMIANEAIFANPWEQGVLCGHKGMKEVYLDLINQKFLIPIEVVGTSGFSFCNYFVGNGSFWAKYFTFVDQILGYLEGQANAGSDVGIIYKGTASYRKNLDMSMRPFIIERLFSSFICQHKELKFSDYKFTSQDYFKKLGFIPGNFCKKMSDMKNIGLLNQDRTQLESWQHQRIKLLNNGENLTTLFHMDDPSTNLVEM